MKRTFAALLATCLPVPLAWAVDADFSVSTTRPLPINIGFLDGGCKTNWDIYNNSPLVVPGTTGTGIVGWCSDHVCGANVMAFLDLDRCLANINGKLVPQNYGYYSKSCQNCAKGKDNKTFKCICHSDGKPHDAVIDLNTVVYNYFGHYACFDIYEAWHYDEYSCQPLRWQPCRYEEDTCKGESCKMISGTPWVAPTNDERTSSATSSLSSSLMSPSTSFTSLISAPSSSTSAPASPTPSTLTMQRRK
ncbi:hypothetical protein GGR57DRAFT_121318 [Xylariaceae sp. FL1272]|nr:hypothetical protein GGR57DRAFT_121318 [Xylariaceae sp. FL1272]